MAAISLQSVSETIPQSPPVSLDVQDDELYGGRFRFDFSATGPVTFRGLTLVDIDSGVTHVRLFSAPIDPRFAWIGAELGMAEVSGMRVAADPAEAEPAGMALAWEPSSQVRMEGRLFVAPAIALEIEPRVDRSVMDFDVTRLRAGSDEVGRTMSERFGSPALFPDGIRNVGLIEIELGGSGAIDNLRFERPEQPAGPGRGMRAQEWRALVDYVQSSLEEVVKALEKEWGELDEGQYDEAIARLDAAEKELIHRLTHDCPGARCGCPELRALRALIEERFVRARTLLERKRDALGAGELAGGPRPLAVLASLTPPRVGRSDPTTWQAVILVAAELLGIDTSGWTGPFDVKVVIEGFSGDIALTPGDSNEKRRGAVAGQFVELESPGLWTVSYSTDAGERSHQLEVGADDTLVSCSLAGCEASQTS